MVEDPIALHFVIIGAGLQGICTAYYLADAGAAVTVLERNNGAALEASFANGGYLQAEFPETWNQPGVLGALPKWWWSSLSSKPKKAAKLLHTSELLRLLPWGLLFLRAAKPDAYLRHITLNRELAMYSLDCMAQLRRDLGIEYSRRACGCLFIYRDRNSLERLRPLLNDLSAEWEELDRDLLMQTEPCLRPIESELYGAIRFPRDESADSYLFSRAMAELAVERGAAFKYGRPVSRLVADGSGVTVFAKGKTIRGDALVIAAGAYSKTLASSLGIKLPIAAAKGYSVTIPLGDWPERPRHVISDMGVHAGINVLGSSLRVAGTADFCGFKSGIDPERIAYILGLVEAVLPRFADVMDRSAIKPFAGLRPLSADGLPMIGETGVPNVYVNTGHGGLGWTLAAGSARALAEQLSLQKSSLDLGPFSPLRF